MFSNGKFILLRKYDCFTYRLVSLVFVQFTIIAACFSTMLESKLHIDLIFRKKLLD